MSHRFRSTVVTLGAIVALTLAPLSAHAQDPAPSASLAPSSSVTPAATTQLAGLPAIADLGPPADTSTICAWSGGSLGADGVCSLPSGAITDDWALEAFGADSEAFRVGAVGGPTVLSLASPKDVPVVTGLSFAPALENSDRATKRLNRRQKGKDASVIKNTKTKWADADSVGLVSLHLAEPFDARKRSKNGLFVARLQDGNRVIDAAYSNRQPSLTNAQGRNAKGMAVFDGDRIDFLVPGGLKGPFSAALFYVDPQGRIAAQQVLGSGGPGALLPPSGLFMPVVQCAWASAHVDPAATVDGLTYDMTGMTYTFKSPRVPSGIGAVSPTFLVTLTPDGSRAGQGLDAVTLEVTPDASIREAISLDIDLSALALTGPTGYHLGENPFEISAMSATWQPDDSYSSFDADAARELLREARWVDADPEAAAAEAGAMQADLSDVVSEMARLTGGSPTDSPIVWGWTGCGDDAHAYSVQNPCSLPWDMDFRERLGSLVGESPEMLNYELGSFAPGHTGCTLLGEGDAFVGTWLLSEDFDRAAMYSADILEPFVGIGCEIDELPLFLRQGPHEVGRCPEPPMTIYYDDGNGFGMYASFAGEEHALAQVLAALDHIANPDLDGDGLTDRFDDDIDGDGLANATDPDDDADTVPDWADYAPFDPDTYINPNAFADLLAAMEASGQ